MLFSQVKSKTSIQCTADGDEDIGPDSCRPVSDFSPVSNDKTAKRGCQKLWDKPLEEKGQLVIDQRLHIKILSSKVAIKYAWMQL